VAGSSADDEGDEESAPALGGTNGRSAPRTGSKWGSRGISVSADDGVLEGEAAGRAGAGFSEQEEGTIDAARPGDEDAKMRDPDDLARILDDEDSDDDGVLPSPGAHGVKNGSEWDA